MAPDYSCWFNKLKGEHILEAKLGGVIKELPKRAYSLINALTKLGLLSEEEKSRASAMKVCPFDDYSAMLRAGIQRRLPLTGLEEYGEILLLWEKNGWTTFQSHLKFYNEKDVDGFKLAVEKLLRYFNSMSPTIIDPLKNSISAPGVARKLLFSTMPRGMYFYLLDDKRRAVHETFKDNLAGGLSMIFHRLAVAVETSIRGGPNKVKNVLGFDCNSLYAHCLRQKLPVGRLTLRSRDNQFKPYTPSLYSASEEACLYMDWMAKTKGIQISHFFNTPGGKEFQVDIWPVDGKVIGQNWVIQYFGCHVHKCKQCGMGDQAINDRDDFMKSHIESLGYKVTIVWSHQFKSLLQTDPQFKAFVKYHRRPRHHPGGFNSIGAVISAVMDNSLYGALVVDIHVEQKDREFWREYPPLVLNCLIPFSMWGAHMQEHAKKHKLSTSPRRLLTSGFEGVKILVISDLLKYYISMGLVVTKIYEIFEFEGGYPFVDFIDKLTDLRRQGDKDKDKAVLASLAKLLANSSYGSLLFDPLRSRKVEILKADGQCRPLFHRLKHRNFRDISTVSEDVYEVRSLPNAIQVKTPYYVGLFVLQLAKLRQLNFIYDCLAKYIPRDFYQLLACDTDSAYLSLASHDLISLIPSHLRPSFKAFHSEMFVVEYCPRHEDLYFRAHFSGKPHQFSPCSKCREIALYTKRSLGLYKIEARGDYFIGLCSKCYVLKDSSNPDHPEIKTVAKGVRISQIRNPLSLYAAALFQQARPCVKNTGFKSHEGQVRTYTVQKYSFSYFYVKRLVHQDGITTSPIPHLILSPYPQQGDPLTRIPSPTPSSHP